MLTQAELLMAMAKTAEKVKALEAEVAQLQAKANNHSEVLHHTLMSLGSLLAHTEQQTSTPNS